MVKANSIKNWGNRAIIEDEKFSNIHYFRVLRLLHEHVDYEEYLEIGVFKGKSLKLSKNKVTGVDPDFKIESLDNWEKINELTLYPKTSDDYFEHLKVHKIKPHFGFAFIDGLHTFDQVLKDMYNIIPHMDKNGVLAFHDVMPRTVETSYRERETRLWTGDVWLAFHIINSLNIKDLNLVYLNCKPSGLLLMENYELLNNANIKEKVFNKVEKFLKVKQKSKEYEKILYEYVAALNVVSTERFIKNHKKILKNCLSM